MSLSKKFGSRPRSSDSASEVTPLSVQLAEDDAVLRFLVGFLLCFRLRLDLRASRSITCCMAFRDCHKHLVPCLLAARSDTLSPLRQDVVAIDSRFFFGHDAGSSIFGLDSGGNSFECGASLLRLPPEDLAESGSQCEPLRFASRPGFDSSWEGARKTFFQLSGCHRQRVDRRKQRRTLAAVHSCYYVWHILLVKSVKKQRGNAQQFVVQPFKTMIDTRAIQTPQAHNS